MVSYKPSERASVTLLKGPNIKSPGTHIRTHKSTQVKRVRASEIWNTLSEKSYRLVWMIDRQSFVICNNFKATLIGPGSKYELKTEDYRPFFLEVWSSPQKLYRWWGFLCTTNQQKFAATLRIIFSLGKITFPLHLDTTSFFSSSHSGQWSHKDQIFKSILDAFNLHYLQKYLISSLFVPNKSFAQSLDEIGPCAPVALCLALNWYSCELCECVTKAHYNVNTRPRTGLFSVF